jgi:uncharacterized membrane protein YhaH (DUF805 family)
MNSSPPPPPTGIGQIIFLVIVAIPLAIFIHRMSKRKGKSGWFALIAFIPYVNVLFSLWIASLPDIKMLRDIEELKQRVFGNENH